MNVTTGSELTRKFNIELKFGGVIGLLTILWLLGEYSTGLHHKYHDLFLLITNFVFIIPIVGIYLGISSKRKNYYDQQLTFGQGVLTGIIISIIYALIAGIGQYLYHTVINPAHFDLMIEKSREHGVSAEEAAQYFNTNNYTMNVVISYFAVGLLASLIHSAILKRKRIEEE